MGPALFDHFSEFTLHNLLKLAASTKKLISGAAGESARVVAELISPHRGLIVVGSFVAEKNVNMRLRAFECLKLIVERVSGEEKETIHASGHLEKLWESIAERMLVKGIGDANSDIRMYAVSIFQIFQQQNEDLAVTCQK